jgi:hypothetical protein
MPGAICRTLESKLQDLIFICILLLPATPPPLQRGAYLSKSFPSNLTVYNLAEMPNFSISHSTSVTSWRAEFWAHSAHSNLRFPLSNTREANVIRLHCSWKQNISSSLRQLLWLKSNLFHPHSWLIFCFLVLTLQPMQWWLVNMLFWTYILSWPWANCKWFLHNSVAQMCVHNWM